MNNKLVSPSQIYELIISFGNLARLYSVIWQNIIRIIGEYSFGKLAPPWQGSYSNGVFVKYLQNNILLKGTKKLTSCKHLYICNITKTPLVFVCAPLGVCVCSVGVCVCSSSYK